MAPAYMCMGQAVFAVWEQARTQIAEMKEKVPLHLSLKLRDQS